MAEYDKLKLNERLAIWVGQWHKKTEFGYKYNRLYLDDLDEPVIVQRGDSHGDTLEWPTDSLPQFTNSLDACNKWLVPNKQIPIVGVYFRYFPGGTECELHYMTEPGFDSVKSWVQAKSTKADYNGEAYSLSSLALCLAVGKVIDNK